MNYTSFALLIFMVTFSKTLVEATRCQPFSTFKIDCDECRCSEDGTEYSCTAKQCGPGLVKPPDEKNSYVLDDTPDSGEEIEFAYLNDDATLESEEAEEEEDDYEYDPFESSEEDSSEEEWDSGLPDDYRRKRKVQEKRYVRPHGKRHA